MRLSPHSHIQVRTAEAHKRGYAATCAFVRPRSSGQPEECTHRRTVTSLWSFQSKVDCAWPVNLNLDTQCQEPQAPQGRCACQCMQMAGAWSPLFVYKGNEGALSVLTITQFSFRKGSVSVPEKLLGFLTVGAHNSASKHCLLLCLHEPPHQGGVCCDHVSGQDSAHQHACHQKRGASPGMQGCCTGY